MPSGYPDYRQNVDISAQSVGNIQVDIIAQTLANMNIDIIAQTIGNLNIDIAAQGLSQIINRPKYGGANATLAWGPVTANGTKTMYTITGTGIIYTTYGHLVATADQQTDIPFALIDDNQAGTITWQELFERYRILSDCGIFNLTQFDLTKFEYAFTRGFGTTFESSYSERYAEASGNTPTYYARTYYALI